jgi:hypothetical protein
MNTDKKYFVKNAVAAAWFGNAKPATKHIFICCSQCDGGPLYTQDGFTVVTSLSRTQLKKMGILVSSSNDTYTLP